MSSFTRPMTFLMSLVLAITALFGTQVTAQTPIANPTTAGPSATAVASTNGYSYVGCWNETTGFPGTGGARALQQGSMTASNVMTIEECVGSCSNAQYQFAGLEYGRECYCGAYLSPLSTQLNASSCNFACDGNATEFCGGSLTITLYNRTASASSSSNSGGKTGDAWRSGAGFGWATAAIVALGFALVL